MSLTRRLLSGLMLSVILTATVDAGRRDLASLSPAQRSRLAYLIERYLTESEIAWHMNIRYTNPRSFFGGHQTYIKRLEAHLRANGGERFLPLPGWDPGTPVPREFSAVKPPRAPLTNLNPRMPLPYAFWPQNLRRFATVTELHRAVYPWHLAVHARVGGAMRGQATAPATPLFFCWLAYLDDVYDDWLKRWLVPVHRR